MRDKKIEVDTTLREIPAYTLGEVPHLSLGAPPGRLPDRGA